MSKSKNDYLNNFWWVFVSAICVGLVYLSVHLNIKQLFPLAVSLFMFWWAGAAIWRGEVPVSKIYSYEAAFIPIKSVLGVLVLILLFAGGLFL